MSNIKKYLSIVLSLSIILSAFMALGAISVSADSDGFNYITNGDFSNGLENWEFTAAQGDNEPIAVNDNICYIGFRPSENGTAYNRVINQSVTLPAGDYAFSFDTDISFTSAKGSSFLFGISDAEMAMDKWYRPIPSDTTEVPVATTVVYEDCDALSTSVDTANTFDSGSFAGHSTLKSVRYFNPNAAGRYLGKIIVYFSLSEQKSLRFSVGCISTATAAYFDNIKVVNEFPTQHMEVDFSDYEIKNGKDNGNTRFGASATDGITFSIDGVTDKYMHFGVSSAGAGRYTKSDRACIINPTGGTNAATSYSIKESANYRVTFDYQVTKEDGTGPVYAKVYSNSDYYIKSTTIGNSFSDYLAVIKLDSTVPSQNKSGWYTATADLAQRTDTNTKSSLAFAFLTARNGDKGSGYSYDADLNFPYEINIDNVVVDRLGSLSFVYPNGNVDTSYGLIKATENNKSSGEAYSTSNVVEQRTLPLGNYKWYSDIARTNPVTTSTVSYSSNNLIYYANSTLIFDTNNDETINLLDLVRTKKHIANNLSINFDSLGSYAQFDANYLAAQRMKLLGVDKSSDNPFEAYNLQLEFSDDFNDASLNTQTWTTANGKYSTHISSLRTADDQYLRNGYLYLPITKLDQPWSEEKDGTTYTGYFRTGSISTKDTFGYGYYEVSYKYPVGDSANCNCSFWLSNNSAEIPTEIDVNEGRMRSSIYTNLHADGTTNQKQFTAEEDLTADFHRYGLLWTEDTVKWYLDGVCIRAEDVSELSLTDKADMSIKLSLALTKINDLPVIFENYQAYANEFDALAGQSMQVDYVRYYSIK